MQKKLKSKARAKGKGRGGGETTFHRCKRCQMSIGSSLRN